MTKKDYAKITWPIFFQLISLPQKLTGLMPLLFGFAYAQYAFGRIDWINTLLYFVAQFCVALFVSGFNHVQDFKKAKDSKYLETTNIISYRHLNPKHVLYLMFSFLLIACSIFINCLFNWNYISFSDKFNPSFHRWGSDLCCNFLHSRPNPSVETSFRRDVVRTGRRFWNRFYRFLHQHAIFADFFVFSFRMDC